MDILNGHVMNLANSIIGVSVLAMPYCFKQCGIILSVLLLVISNIVSRLTCHFLLKSAIISRRKTFEFLAFYLFGGFGKLAVEIGMIGFLLGTCIAYFVVMGDLGPVIIAEVTKFQVTNTMHTSILMALALFVVLPLGLLRNVHSLNGVSKATMIFYSCLVLKVVLEALPHLFEENWYANVNLWRPEGLLQCIPIFSMALFCQTQLFEMYEVVPNPTLDKMNILIRAAVNLCTIVYICVGLFGYIAFANRNFTGNILLSFEPSFVTHVMKVGFVLSVAFSFPLVIFPCRAALYSLLYKEGYSSHEGNLKYIPEGKFKALTFVIVFISLIIGILIPNIELVLGLVGSTIGVMICVLFPVTCFICVSHKNTNERILAQVLLALGVFVMVVGTYKNIQRVDNFEDIPITNKPVIQDDPIPKIESVIHNLPVTEKPEIRTEAPKKVLLTEKVNIKEVRHEPPQPIEPFEDEPKKIEKLKIEPPKELLVNDTANDLIDKEAIKKEDKEEKLEQKDTVKQKEDDHKVLIDTIQKQNEVQKEIVEQQKQLLEAMKKQQQQQQSEDKNMDEVKQEKMKAVKEIETIALKAIEKISEGEDSKKVVADMKKGIEEKKLNNPVNDNVLKEDELRVETSNQKELKESKEFEKNADNFQKEIQELSSQLNQVDKELKHDDLLHKEESNNVLPPTKTQTHSKDEPETNIDENNQNIKKTGSVLLKITDDNIPPKLIPLPIAISQKKNTSKLDSTFVDQKKEEKNEILESNQSKDEAQAMRRDILSLSTKN